MPEDRHPTPETRDLTELRLDYLEAAHLQLLDRVIAAERTAAFESSRREALERLVLAHARRPLQAEVDRLRDRAQRAARAGDSDPDPGDDLEAELVRRSGAR